MRTDLFIAFDAVGTLIYPDPDVASAYAAVARRYGSKLTRSEIAHRFRAVFGEIETRDQNGDLRTSEAREYARWQEIVRRVLNDVLDHDACFAELYDHFARPGSWRPFPEVPAVLTKLSGAGMRLALASNFDLRLRAISRQIESLRLCQPVLVASEIGYRKPHAEFFQAIIRAAGNRRLGVFYVGDDADNDAAAARSAGLEAILLDRSGSSPSTIASLSELRKRLGVY
jgi:putative hydrolase of the HAD superfamily